MSDHVVQGLPIQGAVRNALARVGEPQDRVREKMDSALRQYRLAQHPDDIARAGRKVLEVCLDVAGIRGHAENKKGKEARAAEEAAQKHDLTVAAPPPPPVQFKVEGASISFPGDGVMAEIRIDTGRLPAVGETLEANGNGYRVKGTVGYRFSNQWVRLEAGATVEREPLPAVVNNTLTLPNSSHATARHWKRGEVVKLAEGEFKVKARKEEGRRVVYSLTPMAEVVTKPKPIRFVSERQARDAQGTAIQAPDGTWVHAKTLTRYTHQSAEGDEVHGYSFALTGPVVTPERAAKINDVHPGLLARALGQERGERVRGSMPVDAVELIPKDHASLAASGERIALTADGALLHERLGDPDQHDSWYHYVVRITDPALVARARRFVAANK